MFLHSCLGKIVILAAILLVLFIIAILTKPTEKEMREEMNDNIMQCMEMNDSIRGDQIDDYVHNIGYIFTKADTTKVGEEWRNLFNKYNRMEIYNHSFFRTAYVYNNVMAEGTRVGFGIFGLVIPTANFNDFLLRTGPMRRNYNEKLIKSTTIEPSLGTNPNVQEFHYKRNPDD
jgi:hypothetical protein